MSIMGITEKQRAALTQILDTAADLDRWRLRAHRVEEPERGSELAVDDEIFQRMAISQFTRLSLMAAGEHLRLALDGIQAKQLYPSSHFTVLRGALVGASQAVLILAPEDRDVRRERGLTVLTEMYAQMDKYYSFLDSTQLNNVDRASLKDQQVWLSERRDDVASIRSTKATLNVTDVIGLAADHVFADTTSRDAVRRIWREMSADHPHADPVCGGSPNSTSETAIFCGVWRRDRLGPWVELTGWSKGVLFCGQECAQVAFRGG